MSLQVIIFISDQPNLENNIFIESKTGEGKR